MTDNTNDRPTLFTVGHSDHDLTTFLSLLARHGITEIADVRSQPYSRFHPQFNREPLAEQLDRSKINYVFLGRELGARRTERESYQNRQARYDLIRRLPAFAEGLDRIRRDLVSHRVALLCAEKDPITCHRTVLICRELRRDPIQIEHILDNGEIETNHQAETRLIEEAGLPATHLFYDRSQLVEQAYDLQSERIAYVESETPPALIGGFA
jgi:uncharacterized protein (DUF488 family)